MFIFKLIKNLVNTKIPTKYTKRVSIELKKLPKTPDWMFDVCKSVVESGEVEAIRILLV